MSSVRHATIVVGVLACATPLRGQGTGRPLGLEAVGVVRGASTDLYGRNVYAFLRRDNDLILADVAGLRVLFVTPGGDTRAIGQVGEGPGEFRHIRNIGPADHGGFWVSDTRLLRVQLFDETGDFVRTIRYDQSLSVPPSAELIQYPIALYPASRLLMYSTFGAGDGDGFTRGHRFGDVALVATEEGEANPRSVVWVAQGERCSYAMSGARTFSHPFCVSPQIDASPDGQVAVVVSDLSGTGPDGEIVVTVYSLTRSGMTKTLRIPVHSRRHVRPDERESLRDQATKRFRFTPDMLPIYEALVAATEYHAAFDRLMVADDGTAWIGLPTDDGRTWVLIGSAGNVLGHASLPYDETPIAARGKILWTMNHDADGFIDLYQYQVE